MNLKKPNYRPRLIDTQVALYLESFGAVSIEGPKFCGKTWTALNHAKSVVYLMDPSDNYAARQSARVNPSSLLKGEMPRLIDEWQEAPGIWDAVRFEVDKDSAKGRFLLTGSSMPAKEAPAHSGAGRIARLNMRTMSLFESGESTGDVSLAGLLKGESFDQVYKEVDLEPVALACVRGGWPESIGLPAHVAERVPMQYLEAIYASDISGLDNQQRNPHKVAELLRALARNNATLVSNKALKWDVTEGVGSISSPTVAAYLSLLKRLFVLEELPGWAPGVRSKIRVRTSPKRYLTDPSLATAALFVSADRLLSDHTTFGSIFEGLCLRDLSIYASLMNANLFHYHDNTDLEVDAIIELADGTYGAVEIKLGGGVDEGAAVLTRFRQKMIAQGAEQPTTLIVITASGLLHKRSDGVAVVPITCLRD